MSRENTSGLGVNKLYGATENGTGGGVVSTYGNVNEVTFQFGADAEVNSVYRVPLAQKSILTYGTLFFDTSGGSPVTDFDVEIRNKDTDAVLATESFTPAGLTGEITLTTLAGNFAGSAGLDFVFIPTTLAAGEDALKVAVNFKNLTSDVNS